MASLHEDTYLVVSTTLDSNGDNGCFAPRSEPVKTATGVGQTDEVNAPSTIYARESIPHSLFSKNKLIVSDIRQKDLELNPLFDRAWVLQERLLARGVLHYTAGEMMWECKEAYSCERGAVEDKQERRFEASKPKFSALIEMAKPKKCDEAWNYWWEVARRYWARSLTFHVDKLPALSGIARRMQSDAFSEYVARFWASGFVSRLTWRAKYKVNE
ncbi:hypothetical protein MMC28_004907 [Mycoblastus sanguinarius]|nr:hypothetical protein [Mycoblastus sanguinarius]